MSDERAKREFDEEISSILGSFLKGTWMKIMGDMIYNLFGSRFGVVDSAKIPNR